MAITNSGLRTLVLQAKYNGMDQTAVSNDLNTKNVAVTDLDVDVAKLRRRALRLSLPGKLEARIAWARGRVALAATKNGADEVLLGKLLQSQRILFEDAPISMTTAAEAAEFTNALQLWEDEGFINGAQRTNFLGLAAGFISAIEQAFARGDICTPEQVERARR